MEVEDSGSGIGGCFWWGGLGEGEGDTSWLVWMMKEEEVRVRVWE